MKMIQIQYHLIQIQIFQMKAMILVIAEVEVDLMIKKIKKKITNQKKIKKVKNRNRKKIKSINLKKKKYKFYIMFYIILNII